MIPEDAHDTSAPRMRLTPVSATAATASSHPVVVSWSVSAMAAEMGLAIFGSSDYHGAGKPNRIGENTTDPKVIAEVVAQGRIEVVEP